MPDWNPCEPRDLEELADDIARAERILATACTPEGTALAGSDILDGWPRELRTAADKLRCELPPLIPSREPAAPASGHLPSGRLPGM